MQQSTFWEASSYSSGQKISRILWNLKVYYCFCKSVILTYTDPNQLIQPIYLGFILILSYPQLVLPGEHFPSGFPHQNPVRTSVVPTL
jgi:hypothetical protein